MIQGKSSYLWRGGITFVFISILLVGFSSCRRSCCNGAVKQTYLSELGKAISYQEWLFNQKTGEIVSLMKDGALKTESYSQGQLDGIVTITFPHSLTIHKEQEYETGKLKSELINYVSGNPKEQIVYLNDGAKEVRTWYEDGSPKSIEQYDNNLLLVGQYFNYVNEEESRVINKNGVRSLFDEMNRIATKQKVVDGEVVLSTDFYDTGTPSAITPYHKEKVHGQRKTFTPQGEPKTIETWVEGRQEGDTVLFKNGRKVAVLPYVHNKIHGVERRFNEAGKIVEEITWNYGQRHGPTKLYFDDTSQTSWYFRNRPVSRIIYEELCR